MVIFMAEDDGQVGKAHVDHYRSIEGPGLVIVEGTAVLREGRINSTN
jgi:2,4-dienoyl-CoA reductase-like NADH-dependent reductase (Old Yellow Enzyme family)